MSRKWKDIKKKFVVEPRFAHLTEANAVRAGESAFKARIPLYNNPYQDAYVKNAWIRGFKRAERDFFDGLKRSAQIQESLPLEEAEA